MKICNKEGETAKAFGEDVRVLCGGSSPSANESGDTTICPFCGEVWDTVVLPDRHCYAAFGMCWECGVVATTDFDYGTPNEAIAVLMDKITSWDVYTEGKDAQSWSPLTHWECAFGQEMGKRWASRSA